MVESPNSAAQMVRRLYAVNRWCVTGTPITKSINDLFGLLAFLRVPLFSNQIYWEKLIMNPYSKGNSKPLVDLLSLLFWRNSKSAVLDQIGVPPMKEQITFLTFTPVEEHMYRHKYSASKMNTTVSQLQQIDKKTSIRNLDRRLVDRFLEPLIPLRRTCSDLGRRHGSHTGNPSFHAPKGTSLTMTMDQVLEDLVQRGVTTCADYNRQYVCHLNGMAGLKLLEGDIESAVELYRQVLWASKEQANICETDKLQLIHAIHNLNIALNMAKDERIKLSEQAVSDSELPHTEGIISNAFVEKSDIKVKDSLELVEKSKKDITNLDEEISDDDWWANLFESLFLGDKGADSNWEDLCYRFESALSSNASSSSLLKFINRGPRQFLFQLSSKVDTLEESRQRWITSLGILMKMNPENLLSGLLTCSCTSEKFKQKKGDCEFCLAMEKCVDYEAQLFSTRVKSASADDKDEVLNWSDSELIRFMRILVSFAKRSEVDSELIKSGEKCLERFSAFKVEFRHLRLLWTALKDRTGAQMELRMARNRLKLADEENPAGFDSVTCTAFVDKYEIPHLIKQYESDSKEAKFNFDQACGQLRYLRTLTKTSEETNQDQCPVCMNILGHSWAVLPCAHCVCLDCVTTLRSMVLQNRRYPCPVCRRSFEQMEMAYVSLRPVDEIFPEEPAVEIKGNLSTKIMAVVKVIKVILKKDPSAKFLVFSNWIDALSGLREILQMNDISSLLLQRGGSRKKQKRLANGEIIVEDNFTSTLRKFRDLSLEIVALLLPYSSGSNGLNLTEANHVILMDPCLTASTDSQAIARVYRIGQTRPTTIHRLLIRSTIEQRIYSVLLAKKTHVHEEVDNEEETVDIEDEQEDAIVGDLVDLYRSELLQT